MGNEIRVRGLTAVFGLLCIILASCADATPLSELPEPERVEAVLAEARKIDGLESLALSIDGELRLETYLKGSADDLRDVRSVTKSVVSLLTGVALERGDLESLDQTLGGFFPELAGTPQAELSLGQLITMSAGLRWDEDRLGEYIEWSKSAAPRRHYLDREPIHPPGQAFSYCSGASHVLGEALVHATGKPLPEFAREALFEPLGIDRAEWETLADGSINAASGIDLRTLDLLRIGQLVLAGGRWKDRQVVPADWVRQSTSRQIPVGPVHYGYQWWVIAPDPMESVMAIGFGGQHVVAIPELGAVIVATARWTDLNGPRADRQSQRIREFFRETLIPAFVATR